MEKGIDKIAQRRSAWQWIKEKGNVSRQFAERFSTEFSEQMANLRIIDAEIREEVKTLKPNLKMAKKSLNNRKYLDVIHFVSEINKTIKSITDKVGILSKNRDEYLDEFYGDFEHADLFGDYLAEKTAGVFDFLLSDRARAAKILDRAYKNTVKKRHAALTTLVSRAEGLVHNALTTVSALGDYRASGDISEYIAGLDKLNRQRLGFENEYKSTYTSHVQPMVERMRQRQQPPQVATPEPEIEAVEEPEASVEEPAVEAPPAEKKPFPKPPPRPDPYEPITDEELEFIEEKKTPPPLKKDELVEEEGEYEIPERLMRPYEGPLSGKRRPVVERDIETGEFRRVSEKIKHEKFLKEVKSVLDNGDLPLVVAMVSDYSQQLEDRENNKDSAALLNWLIKHTNA